ncbi:MAG: YihY/virulence factor BrkB family protein [Ferruginibacter sp.]
MRIRIKSIFRFIKQVFSEYIADNVLKYSASLAYYTILSIAPLLIIILYITGILFGQEAIRGEIFGQLKDLVGSSAALDLQTAIQNIHLSKGSFLATMLGAIILFIGATGIFGEMQDSLNKIWGLRTKSRKVWWKLLVDRAISFSLILSLGFVMIVSLVVNAIVAALSNKIGQLLVGTGEEVLLVLDNLTSLIITTLMFATIFKVLPDAKIKWKDVLVGALITAVLFILGKYGIGFYLLKSSLTDIYGAAGSIMIMMIWVYYSSAILYLGAVFTKVYASNYGSKIYPNEYSVWVKIEEIPVGDVTLNEKIT